MAKFFFFFYSLCVGFFSYLLIINGYLGQQIKKYVIFLSEIKFFNKFLFYTSLISTILLLIVIFSDPHININDFIDNTYNGISLFSSEGASGSNIPSLTDNTLNINTPHINVSASQGAIQRLVAAGSTAAGLSAGVKLAQSFPTAPGKAAALVGSVALAHAAPITATKIGNVVNPTNSPTGGNNNTSGTNNYIQNNNLLENPHNTSVDPEFPMNLLPDLDTYANLELIFLFFILNAALSTFLINKNIDFTKYIPKNKIGKLIEFLLARYIKIWYTSNVFIFSLSWVCLFICVFISKICLYFLLQI
jgi:hypothetical protein